MGEPHRLTCATSNCGTFIMDAELVSKLKETGETFHCPSGHPQHFTGEDTREQLKKKIGRLQDRVESLESELEREKRKASSYSERCTELYKDTRELRNTISEYRERILQGENGAVELPDGEFSWACECGSIARSSFDSEREAWRNYDKHRERESCTASGKRVVA